MKQALAIHNPLSPRDAMAAAIMAFEQRCMAKNLTEDSLRYYRYRLQAFDRFLEKQGLEVSPGDVTPRLIREFLTDETTRVSAVTAHHSHLTLRCFFRFLVDDGFIEQSPMKGVEHPRQKQPIIPTFTLDQITAMLATCSAKTFIDQRDRAIIVLLFDSGLRVSELCGLTMDAINWSEQTMLILGKGNKERLVPFGAMAKQAMLSSMARRGDLATAYFFTTGYGDQLSRRRALEIIQTRGTTAGVKGVRLSPHTIRHTFAVNYLRNGGDVFSLQKMLGHSDLAMTRRYAELSQNDVQAKHRLYSPADSLPQTTAATGRKRLR